MSRRNRHRTCALSLALLAGLPVCVAADPPEAPAAVAPAGEPAYFEGKVDLPGLSLPFSLRLVRGLDGQPSGTIDIPMQGLRDGPLADLVWTAERLAFTMHLPGQDESLWPSFDFELSPDASESVGVLRQAGMEYSATIASAAGEPAGPNRPQHPQEPFPYAAHEVEFRNEPGDLTIAGTLTVPPGEGPFPCAVLITGSGAQDRDETLFEHKPFLVIADHLTRHGIAVLRCDDRGVGGTETGSQEDPDTRDMATDVEAAIEFLMTRDEVDPTRIGLIGHSEGALIGPYVAAREPVVSFLVMLAGPGVPGDEILIRQAGAMLIASGESPESVEEQGLVRERLFDAIKADDTEAARAALLELMRMSVPDGMSAEMIERAAEGQMEVLGSRWMRTFLAMDPREALREVRVPVLVLNGDLDLQVLHDQNVPEVERALAEAGNQDVTVRVLPGLNHFFQPATTGALAEYGLIETTFDPAVLELMTRWILERMGGAAGGTEP